MHGQPPFQAVPHGFHAANQHAVVPREGLVPPTPRLKVGRKRDCLRKTHRGREGPVRKAQVLPDHFRTCGLAELDRDQRRGGQEIGSPKKREDVLDHFYREGHGQGGLVLGKGRVLKYRRHFTVHGIWGGVFLAGLGMAVNQTRGK